MSMPEMWGARRVVVREISAGEETPSWAMVGVDGLVEKVGESVKSAGC